MLGSRGVPSLQRFYQNLCDGQMTTHVLQCLIHYPKNLLNKVRLMFNGWSKFGKKKFLLVGFKGFIYNLNVMPPKKVAA